VLQGAITALITPMTNDSVIDFVSVENIVNQQIKAGVSGLVIAGTTGEGVLLDNNEKVELLKRVIAINQGRIKIIAGLSQTSTKFSCDFLHNYLNKIMGLDYILALTPCYIKPTQHGLYDYFTEIAKNTATPIILYNVPSRTSCDLENDTVLRLATTCKNIIGLKDATGDIERGCELILHKPQDFLLYSGDDKTSLQFMLNGGDGVISVIRNIIPDKITQICTLALSARNDEKISNEANLLNEEIAELVELLFIESNPIPVKWAACALDLIKSPYLRSPLTELTVVNQKKLAVVLQKLLGYKC
jgi:4-hydroxy-tetrahydrodipicolinate synthase